MVQIKKIILIIFLILSLSLLVVSCSVDKNNPRVENQDSTNSVTDIVEFPQIGETYVTYKAAAGTYEFDGNTPVYVNVHSHNEDSWIGVVGSLSKYEDYRTNLVEKIQTIVDHGAKYNWETDYVVLEAMDEYEPQVDQSNTNNKHILLYLTQDLGFSIDPHTHTYNMADITKLISDQGAISSTVIGGVKAFECELGGELEGSFTTVDWREELSLNDNGLIAGEIYNVTWEPKVLSGASMGGHWYDGFASGIWRPGIEENFYQHNDQNDLVIFGQGYPHDKNNLGGTQSSGAVVFYEDGDYIKELVNMIQTGQVPSGKIYTASIHVRDQATLREEDGSSTDTLAGLKNILGELDSLAQDQAIVYVTIEEAVEIWEDKYNSEPNILSISQFSIYNDILAQAKDYCATKPRGRR